MSILVIGGMHGNELLGVKLVELLQKRPIPGIDAILANPEAVRQRRRFIESDLNRSFGAQAEETRETARAKELMQLTKKYDIVLDFHNTQAADNNCSFVGVGCQSELYDVMRTLGLTDCIEATYDCINKYCLNTVSIEISCNDRLDNAQFWYEKLIDLTDRASWRGEGGLSVYRFVRRVTWNEYDRYNLEGWRAFGLLDDTDKTRLDISGDIVPIFIGSRLTEYYATLLKRVG